MRETPNLTKSILIMMILLCCVYLFSYANRSRLPLRTQSFTFSKPKATTHEIAIINVKGSTMDYGMMTEQALQRVRQVQDANRHRLVHAVFRKMQIPKEHWADAIEARGIIVAGFKKPWDITIGTLNDAGGRVP